MRVLTKIKLTLILTTILTADASAVLIDFGERGNTMAIAEPSLKDQFNQSINDFNSTQKKEQFASSIYKTGNSNVFLPQCEHNTSRVVIPQKILSKSYYTPDGRIIAKKGDVYNYLKNVETTYKPRMVILDGENIGHIEFVKKICGASECILWLNSGNSFEFENDTGLKATPVPQPLIGVIGAKCSLSVYDAKNDSFDISEFSIKSGKK